MKHLYTAMLVISCLTLQGCLHHVVTVPAKIAYKTTKGVVKGTVAVTKAVIPGGDDDDDDD